MITELAQAAQGRGQQLLSIIGNIYGTYMSAKQNQKVDDILSGRMDDLKTRFDKDYNTNFLNTEQAQSVMQVLSGQMDKQNKKIAGASAITGGSAEAENAARGESQGRFSEAITRLAGYGTQYKDMKEREYNRRDDSLQNIFLTHEMNKGQNWTNFMNNATNLGQSGSMMSSTSGENTLGSLMDLFGERGLGKGIV